MTKITYKDHQGDSKTVEIENGLTLMEGAIQNDIPGCLLYTSPSPRDAHEARMPSSA